ncbi:O-antigen ligase family protein [Billgrantia montanilacus]|uniref:O-antigen ligase family protein n=1 Tax=Billgrantia montanilacus TaxID=2282305 RepID=A0A368TYD4_9GAMM|nr:O-antigen ligase family protein [Halomonas montanilacus]RCV89366.1 O-antigen ligase family protein [Halomonas montanilacus]
MTGVFARERALMVNQWALLLVLALLIATPIRSHGVVALLMLYSIGYLVVHRHTLEVDRFDWVVIGLLLLFLLSRLPIFWLDEQQSRYLSPGAHMLALVPIYLMLRHLVYPVDLPLFRNKMEMGVILGCLGAFGVALYQTHWLGLTRADGFLFSINLGYLSCAMAFLAASLVRGSRRKAWLLLAALAGVLTCLLTLTRGAILAIPLLLLLVLVLNADRLGWKAIVGALVGVIALAMLSYAALPQVERRVDYSLAEIRNLAEDNIEAAVSSGGRIQLWTAASHAFMERPLIGLGYAEREALNAELVEQGVITEWVLGVSRGHAHSQYFEVAATGGVLGLLALAGYLVVPGIYHWRLYRRDRSNTWSQAGLVFTAGFALYSLTEAAIHHEMMTTFYAYMQVMMLVLALVHRREAPAFGTL